MHVISSGVSPYCFVPSSVALSGVGCGFRLCCVPCGWLAVVFRRCFGYDYAIESQPSSEKLFDSKGALVFLPPHTVENALGKHQKETIQTAV